MNLTPHVDALRQQLAVTAEAGGEDARALAERLTAPLDSAVRLMLLEALGNAAAEITSEIAPGSVEVRLRGGDPEFVVTLPPSDAEAADTARDIAVEAWPTGEGAQARVNLRLPEQLKARVEEAADREGLSINTWLVRAAAAAVERGEPGSRQQRGTPRGAQHHTGWGR
jgi:hypothetical protein